MTVLDEDKTMDNVQKHNIFVMYSRHRLLDLKYIHSHISLHNSIQFNSIHGIKRLQYNCVKYI
jgi:hypothetical protein